MLLFSHGFIFCKDLQQFLSAFVPFHVCRFLCSFHAQCSNASSQQEICAQKKRFPKQKRRYISRVNGNIYLSHVYVYVTDLKKNHSNHDCFMKIKFSMKLLLNRKIFPSSLPKRFSYQKILLQALDFTFKLLRNFSRWNIFWFYIKNVFLHKIDSDKNKFCSALIIQTFYM